ncbi:MAG: RNA polymerase sporulation sigma factor SigK [Clostridia bacterium]|nr:RNA polymerase sporulation sigma factor SigK [Clostridia bacterium]MBR2327131.1 RNA polymerase sporulation sigma factor SigK [Clostridia bacterium]
MLPFLSFTVGFLFLALYLSGKNSFPKPLSPEEEAPLIEKMLSGDKKARSVLIERNLRLVAHIVKKYYAADVDNDDLVSIGTIGLIKGIDSYKGGKNTRLSTYASRCIENEILMYFRSTKKLSAEVSIDETIDTDKDGNSLTLIDVLSVDDTIADDIDLKLRSEKLCLAVRDRLTERERAIIALRYGLANSAPLTQRETAKKLGISRSYVSRIEKKALETLKEEMEK